MLGSRGPPRRLLDFLRLFSKLDDVKTVRYVGAVWAHNTPSTRCAHICRPLRGKLTLHSFWDQTSLEDVIASFGGMMQFVSMDLDDVVAAQLLLDACAEALQTLYFQPGSLFHSCKRFLEVDSAMSELAGTGLGYQPSPSIPGGSCFYQSAGVHLHSSRDPSHDHIPGIPGSRCYIRALAAKELFPGVARGTKDQGISSDIPFGYNRVSRPGICESQGSRYNGRWLGVFTIFCLVRLPFFPIFLRRRIVRTVGVLSRTGMFGEILLYVLLTGHGHVCWRGNICPVL